jgi:pimeloyl-ACP methyl ester carboxylesterase
VPCAAVDLPVEGFATPAAVLAAGRDLTAYNADVARLWMRLASLTVPIEAVAGDADPVCDRNRHVEMLVRVAPDVRVTLLRGVGHMPHHVAPGAVIRAVGRIATGRNGMRTGRRLTVG